MSRTDLVGPGGSDGMEMELSPASPPTAAAAPGPKRGLRALVSSQVMVVLVVVGVSAASLGVMRQQARGNAGTLKAVKIDYDPESHGVAPAEQKRIMAALERSTSPLEIRPEAVQKDPFLLGAGPTPVAAGPAKPLRDVEAERAAQRKAEIQSALGTLSLNGVMEGPVPLARVNGRTVRVGDTVAELFVVSRIVGRSVEVMDEDGATYTLGMGDGASPSSPHSPRGGLRANPMSQPPVTPRRP